MSGRDGFLTRWSRRKLGAEPEAAPAEPAAELEAPAPEPAPAAAAETLSDEELALLPPIDELTSDSDVTAFLRKGVPEVLKKAALRRIWALDPTIRDYVGDARDYAWDWNTPGGVPGYGPLLPGDDMTERLDRMFSRLADPAEPRPDTPDALASVPPAGALPGDAETPNGDSSGRDEAEQGGPRTAESGALPPDDAGPNAPPGELPAPQPAALEPPLRRHGAALPKFDLF